MKLSTFTTGPWAFSSLGAAGFIGMGGPDQQPYCARACRTVLGTANLTCSEMHYMGNHMAMMTTPHCRANDEPFLTSLAYCFDHMCNSTYPLW
ncbi:hypothetical protein BCR34DRAFT_89831 [Clohesyomyces aquaticus]|uniref:Uncharacterized protein n=1 Tax=Clohesyomyces aquaticus TaxID=1231657 RepID=A0A1Y1YVL9_9PLEO|nr:hypothetical protein BCR34DRAFT_89831 [Clohesyomyces aquaticus]